MAERDAKSIDQLRTDAATANTLTTAAVETARRHQARADERRIDSDKAVAEARKSPATSSARLTNQLLHAAQRAHHWQEAYELRCQEADARMAEVQALETALREQERRAALLHGALQIALRRLEGRADE